ncbi:polysaccharide chain length determinant protein, PEP-CTERM locus subfamily [Thermodesulfatator indicus DSM 15286]|uniref:Polysaccharide chain length determinant protein, PEP-CTERM locus subfamily n=1 Tax=Thermodesulfatator indicus (strain DSM 15286 / JCM 11887 / CIR29812) TaxID=667014 RepID=F8A8K4_THEID|nr:XrtA system polysaccharide chain length determinant [Thermodesulfatator indicus]AEH45090.1 polysaccharide chain length determinant protein, PEP-CTERM locus subfamily [Thermodesulfatator indicus DSM 15286]
MVKIKDLQRQIDLLYIITFLWRRKWIIIFSFIPVFAFAQWKVLQTPKLYEAQVVLTISPQKVPSSYVKSTVSSDMEAFIHSIWQEITSRSNLEYLIKEFDLYPEAVKKLPMETVVEKMRKNIKVRRPRGGKRNVLIISYTYYDPVLAAKVVNKIANTFIEENLKLREEQAKTITAFLDEELTSIENELRQREQAIQEYKRKHMAELPEQKQSIIAILQRLQKEYEALQLRKEMLQDRKVAILDQLKKAKDEQNMMSQEVKGDSQDYKASLDFLKQKYAALLTKYTEKHPDVIRLKKLIEKREQEIKKMEEEGENPNTVVGQLKEQLKEIDKELKNINTLIKETQNKINLYQKRLENIPKREQELTDLTRDYNNLMKTYRMLLDKKIQAAMAETLEKRQQGEQFRIIDPAIPPEVPVSPDVKKILAMGFMAALGLGLGLAVLLEFVIDRKVYDPSFLEAGFEVRVLATIPAVVLKKDKIKMICKNVVLSMLACSGLAVNAFLAYKIFAEMHF